jgi:hypothetical protein
MELPHENDGNGLNIPFLCCRIFRAFFFLAMAYKLFKKMAMYSITSLLHAAEFFLRS